MFNGRKITALVPIKMHSQRLAGKNLLPLAGKPLCRHLLETLASVEELDEICVYCSDERIRDYLPQGVTFLKRSTALDRDETKSLEIIEAFCDEKVSDLYLLAHVTSPFIKVETIRHSLQMVVGYRYDSALTVREIKTFLWFQGNPLNYLLRDIPRTQDLPPAFAETSGFYLFRREVFTHGRRRIGDYPYLELVSGAEAIDIDTQEDFELAQKYAE